MVPETGLIAIRLVPECALVAAIRLVVDARDAMDAAQHQKVAVAAERKDALDVADAHHV